MLVIESAMMHKTNQRGAASVEAVIALPVLTLILVSVLWVKDRAVARQAAQNQARSCAWLYSASGCQEIPPGCDSALSTGSRESLASLEIGDVLQGGSQAAAAPGVVGTVVSSLLGSVLDEAFGTWVDAAVSRNVARPHDYGGGERVVSGEYRLACNLRKTTPELVVLDAWHAIFP